MRRLPKHILCLCLSGALLLHLCQGNDAAYEYDYNYNATAVPDYDYNATYDYVYYNNASNVDYDSYILRKSSEDSAKEVDKGNTAPETGLPNLLLITALSMHQLYQLH